MTVDISIEKSQYFDSTNNRIALKTLTFYGDLTPLMGPEYACYISYESLRTEIEQIWEPDPRHQSTRNYLALSRLRK